MIIIIYDVLCLANSKSLVCEPNQNGYILLKVCSVKESGCILLSTIKLLTMQFKETK